MQQPCEGVTKFCIEVILCRHLQAGASKEMNNKWVMHCTCFMIHVTEVPIHTLARCGLMVLSRNKVKTWSLAPGSGFRSRGWLVTSWIWSLENLLGSRPTDILACKILNKIFPNTWDVIKMAEMQRKWCDVCIEWRLKGSSKFRFNRDLAWKDRHVWLMMGMRGADWIS